MGHALATADVTIYAQRQMSLHFLHTSSCNQATAEHAVQNGCILLTSVGILQWGRRMVTQDPGVPIMLQSNIMPKLAALSPTSPWRSCRTSLLNLQIYQYSYQEHAVEHHDLECHLYAPTATTPITQASELSGVACASWQY